MSTNMILVCYNVNGCLQKRTRREADEERRRGIQGVEGKRTKWEVTLVEGEGEGGTKGRGGWEGKRTKWEVTLMEGEGEGGIKGRGGRRGREEDKEEGDTDGGRGWGGGGGGGSKVLSINEHVCMYMYINITTIERNVSDCT